MLHAPDQAKSFDFPQKTSANSMQKRSVQPVWFEQLPWLDHDEKTNKVFCLICMKAIQNNMFSSTRADLKFTPIGYGNWKNAMEKKERSVKHESPEYHNEALTKYVKNPPTAVGDVGVLSDKHSHEKEINRGFLITILSNVRYLARQVQALRGNWDIISAIEINSNFHQLLKLRSEEDQK